jgi:hypothetical protein
LGLDQSLVCGRPLARSLVGCLNDALGWVWGFLYSTTMDRRCRRKELGHCEGRQSRRKRNEEALASLPRAAERARLRKIRSPPIRCRRKIERIWVPYSFRLPFPRLPYTWPFHNNLAIELKRLFPIRYGTDPLGTRYEGSTLQSNNLTRGGYERDWAWTKV